MKFRFGQEKQKQKLKQKQKVFFKFILVDEIKKIKFHYQEQYPKQYY